MNYLDFIKSDAIRDYLKKIEYKPSILDAAYIVWYSRLKKGIIDRHWAWQKIISEHEDVRVNIEGFFTSLSLKGFLNEYMNLEMMLYDLVRKGTDSATYAFFHYDPEVMAYRTFNELTNAIKEDKEGCVESLKDSTVVMNNVNDLIKRIMFRIDTSTLNYTVTAAEFYHKDNDFIFNKVFQQTKHKIPLPFKKGDILELDNTFQYPILYCGRFSDERVYVVDTFLAPYLRAISSCDLLGWEYYIADSGNAHDESYRYLDSIRKRTECEENKLRVLGDILDRNLNDIKNAITRPKKYFGCV